MEAQIIKISTTDWQNTMLRKVGFVQNNPIFGETERNVRRALELASTVEADLLVLPELFNTGYLFTTKEEVERLAEPLDGYTVAR